jgi:molecular chaperone DnaK (HSP70)
MVMRSRMMNDRTFGFGVDLGTSNSAISRVDISSGRPEFADAKDLGGHRDIPSVVYFHADGEMEFGHVAAQRANSPSEAPRVVANVKLLLRSNEPLVIEGLDEPVEPKRIVRGLLAHLKRCAETTLNMPCTRVVISVPAHEEFDVDYRAMVRAAAMEGEPLFESISTVPEPDAVLMSIGDLTSFIGQRVLVVDMGGGTLDVSLRDVEERDGRPYLTQLAVVGSDAAGRRVTEALTNHVLDRWQKEQGFTFSEEERKQAIRINYISIDDAKRHLSNMIRQFGPDSPKAHSCHLISPLGRYAPYTVSVQARELTDLSEDVCADAIMTVQKALARGGCTVDDVDHYFAVGGSSQLPLMGQRLSEFFGREPSALMGQFGMIDSTLAVVRGAAVDDLNRYESPAVPSTTPVLERRIPYAISMVTNRRKETTVLVPEDSVLPFGPVDREFYVTDDGTREFYILLVRGAGLPDDCPVIAPHKIEMIENGAVEERVVISWFIDESGEMTVRAFDKKERELGVFRTSHH